MQKTFPLALLFVSASVLTSNAGLVWMVGLDDNGWPAGDGGGPNTSFLQENGVINPLPGNPVTAVEGPQGADNDYYFAGVYNTALPGVKALYGDYTPVGLVAANEEGAERAFAAADNDLRYHFNLAGTIGPNDKLRITFEPLNLDDPATPANTDLRYGAELYFNGVLVMPQVIIRPGQLNQAIVSPEFTLASVGGQTGLGADNVVSLRGINYNNAGGGNWMGIDYVQLDSTPVPEPTSGLLLLIGSAGLTSFLRRRRA